MKTSMATHFNPLELSTERCLKKNKKNIREQKKDTPLPINNIMLPDADNVGNTLTTLSLTGFTTFLLPP